MPPKELTYEEQILAGCSTPGLRKRSTDNSVPERDVPEDVPEKDTPPEAPAPETNIVQLADVKGKELSERQEEIAKVIEGCLEDAKRGAYMGFAAVYVRPNGRHFGTITGRTDYGGALLGACVALQKDLLQNMDTETLDDESEGPAA